MQINRGEIWSVLGNLYSFFFFDVKRNLNRRFSRILPRGSSVKPVNHRYHQANAEGQVFLRKR